MNSEISEFLQSRIDAGDFPSAVYLVAEKGEIVFQDALGYAVVDPERIEARIDTIYDLASLTKVLVTGLMLAKMLEIAEIALDDKIGHYLKDFATGDRSGLDQVACRWDLEQVDDRVLESECRGVLVFPDHRQVEDLLVERLGPSWIIDEQGDGTNTLQRRTHFRTSFLLA